MCEDEGSLFMAVESRHNVREIEVGGSSRVLEVAFGPSSYLVLIG